MMCAQCHDHPNVKDYAQADYFGLFSYLQQKPEQIVREAVLAGQTFVLTGTLSSLSRDEARLAIEALGGKVASSVSRIQ